MHTQSVRSGWWLALLHGVFFVQSSVINVVWSSMHAHGPLHQAYKTLVRTTYLHGAHASMYVCARTQFSGSSPKPCHCSMHAGCSHNDRCSRAHHCARQMLEIVKLRNDSKLIIHLCRSKCALHCCLLNCHMQQHHCMQLLIMTFAAGHSACSYNKCAIAHRERISRSYFTSIQS